MLSGSGCALPVGFRARGTATGWSLLPHDSVKYLGDEAAPALPGSNI